MLRFHWLFVVLVSACGSPADNGDLRFVERGNGPVVFTGSSTIEEASVHCVDGSILFGMHVNGITGGGLVFMQETANAGPHHAEEHDLVSVDSDPAVPFDDLAQNMLEDAFVEDQSRNEASLFRCRHHIDAEDIMTYAFVALDLTGQVADCVVAGNDPEGLMEGSYERVAEPSVDLSSCDIAKP